MSFKVVNFIVPVLPDFDPKILYGKINIGSSLKINFVFVVDGAGPEKEIDCFKIIPLGGNFGQYYSIYQGMKFLINESNSDSLIIVCDLDAISYILKKLDEIRELVDSGFIVVGINRSKKRRNIVIDFLSELFYSFISLIIKNYLKVFNIEADYYLRDLKYITSFSAFSSEYLKDILDYSRFFRIYIFSLFIMDIDKKNCCFRKRISFLDISDFRNPVDVKSSYSFFKLLKLSFSAMQDLLSFFFILPKLL